MSFRPHRFLWPVSSGVSIVFILAKSQNISCSKPVSAYITSRGWRTAERVNVYFLRFSDPTLRD